MSQARLSATEKSPFSVSKSPFALHRSVGEEGKAKTTSDDESALNWVNSHKQQLFLAFLFHDCRLLSRCMRRLFSCRTCFSPTALSALVCVFKLSSKQKLIAQGRQIIALYKLSVNLSRIRLLIMCTGMCRNDCEMFLTRHFYVKYHNRAGDFELALQAERSWTINWLGLP